MKSVIRQLDRPAQARAEEELQRVRLLPRRHGGGRGEAQGDGPRIPKPQNMSDFQF